MRSRQCCFRKDDGIPPSPGASTLAIRMSSQLTVNAGEALPHLGPVGRLDRIELLDVLRGFALFGILLVNIVSFGLPDSISPHELWPGLIDVAAEKLILFFGFGKF